MRVAFVLVVIAMVSSLATSYRSKPDDGLINPRDRHAPTNGLFRGRIQLAQVQYDNKCFTPNFWCFLPQAYPINTPCWCATPYGPVQGVVR